MTTFENRNNVCVIGTDEIVIRDVQSALDLIATAHYHTNSRKIAIDKSAIIEDFFDLKTKLAGEILQKFVQYHCQIAIVGDFSVYSSKSLRDFIYESNQGSHVLFLSTVDEAVERLSKI